MTRLNKRILSGVFGFCFAVASVGVYKTNAENEKLAGDINADGVVTSSDYPSMVKYFTNQIEADKISVINADINEDGKVNIVDVIMLKESLLTPKEPSESTTVVTTISSETNTTSSVSATTEILGTTPIVTTIPTADTIELVTTTPVTTVVSELTTTIMTTTPEPTTTTPEPTIMTVTTTTVPESTTTTVTTTVFPHTTTEVTTTTSQYTDDISDFELQIVEKINEWSEKNGYGHFSLNELLSQCAEARARELETSYSAYRPDGSHYRTLLNSYGIYGDFYQHTGKGITTVSDMVQRFVNLATKQSENGLRFSKYTKIGIGVYDGYWVVFLWGL